MEYNDPNLKRNPNLFSGIRFVLAGFHPLMHDQVKAKLVSDGGIYFANYSPDCTHVIVYELPLDDPICVAARKDRKALVTSLWIDHSLEAAELLDVSDIMYRPLKDLKGIPGAEELVICLTGFQKYLRMDITTMVELMGAQFSKELNANKVTHLVCYKFEGEKYLFAKKWPKIKIINHHWLEDCLKTWKILPEEHYDKSTYEVEMEAEVNDSEDETGDISARVTNCTVMNDIPSVQNESERVLDKSVSASNLSTPSAAVSKLPLKAEPVSELRNLHKIDSHSPIHQNNDETNAKKTQVNSGPFLVGKDLGNLSGPSSKRSADIVTDYSSPLSARATPKSSKVSAEKSGSSNRKTKEFLESDDVCNPYSELEKVKGASASVETLSPGRSSVSLQPNSMLSNLEERLQEDLIDKETADVGVLPDLHQMNQLGGHPVVSCIPPKLQKLMVKASKTNYAADTTTKECSTLDKSKNDYLNIRSHTGSETTRASVDNSSTDLPLNKSSVASASKTNDAANTATKECSTLDESKNDSLNIRSHTGCETTRASVDNSSTDLPLDKSSVKNIATSICLPFERSQASNSSNIDVHTSPISSIFALPGVKNNTAKPLNIPENASFPPQLKKLVASDSGNHALNSDDQTDGVIAKAQKKKMVAKKTSGSRPKVSKKTADDRKCSLSGNFSGVNAGLHLDDQIKDKQHETSPVTDKILARTADGSTVVEPLQDYAKPFNDDTDEAEATNSPSDNTNKLQKPEGKSKGTEHTKKNLAAKQESSRRLKETVISAPKVVQDADIVRGKANEKKESVKGQTVAAAGKKRSGDQLLKEPVSTDDPGACNDGKRLKNLVSIKRRGTLLLNNKIDNPNVVEKDIESTLNEDGQHNSDKQSEKLSGTSNQTNVLMEIQNENIPIAGNCLDTNNGVKLTGKKRRGTLLLRKSEDPISKDKENLSVLDGKPGTSNESIVSFDQGAIKGKKNARKKRRGTLVLSKPDGPDEGEKENEPVFHDHEDKSKSEAPKSDLNVRKNNTVTSDALNIQNDSTTIENEPACFIVSGHRLQRKEFQQLIKRLKGKLCRDSHQWSYQATHFIVPDPIRRTEKFFAAVASGSWVLKTDYLTESSQAGKFLPEEPYEWHKNGLTEDGAINLEAPRKWRLLREKTGHGAFNGMRIVVYGECIAPPLDTLKRVVKAGDGTILATSPPYTRFLNSGVDFAIVSPGITRADIWVQEFLQHEIPCVSADYLVEYVCKPGYPLDRHVQYNTHEWAAKSFSRLSSMSIESVIDPATPENLISNADLACQVCGFSDRAEVMLICGDESGFIGCGVGTHIDCCVPPLEDIPNEDWFCPKCTESKTKPPASTKKKALSKRR